MIDLYDLDEQGLRDLMAAWGQPAFRAGQIRRWLYEHDVTDVDEMTNLSKALRARLAAETRIGSLAVDIEQPSRDGTIKRLYRCADGRRIETVLMPYRSGRRTVCVSTQAGCAMGCAFCATGQMGFERHLTRGEIVEQVQRYAAKMRADGDRLSNVVLMGMGEPFHNYDAVLGAIRGIMQDVGIGARHITVSTVGLVPMIRRFAEEGLQVTLAVSLHSVDDAHRSAMMPINRRWPVSELMAACRDYAQATGRRVTFEWALIAGDNDDEATALALAKTLRGLPCHVNLIPLNPTRGFDGRPTDDPAASRFVATLAEHGIPATVRVRRGLDIDAGCGQLRDRADQEQAASPPA